MLHILLLMLITTTYSEPQKQSKYSLKTNFPIYEDDDFRLNLHTDNEKVPVYTIVIVRCSKNGEIVEEHILNPGYLKALPGRLNGDCFQVVNYWVRPHLIEILLRFKRKGDGGKFHLFFLETGSVNDRKRLLDNSEQEGGPPPVLVLGISLLLHWRLELVQRTLDHREGGLLPGSTGLLICRASGGAPFSQVRFVDVARGLTSLQYAIPVTAPPVASSLETPSNEAHLSFFVRIRDHMRVVGCQAGNDQIEQTIKVFHHPTKLVFSPESSITSGFVGNGSSISCSAGNGYPSAQAHWTWISGPPDAPVYFSITPESGTDGSDGNRSVAVLSMSPLAPLNSQWTFQCAARNTIANSVHKGVVMMVSFTIGEAPVPYVFIACLVLGSLIIVLLLAGLLWYCIHTRRARAKRSSMTKEDLLRQSSLSMIKMDIPGEEKSQSMVLENGSVHKVNLMLTSNPVDEV